MAETIRNSEFNSLNDKIKWLTRLTIANTIILASILPERIAELIMAII